MLSDCKYKISVLPPPNSIALFTEHLSHLFPGSSVSLSMKWVGISDNISLTLGYLIPFHHCNFFLACSFSLCSFTSHISFLHYSFYQFLLAFLSIFVMLSSFSFLIVEKLLWKHVVQNQIITSFILFLQYTNKYE